MTSIKNIKINSIKQLIDLNGEKVNFDLNFEIKTKNKEPFEISIVTQNILDSTNNLEYTKVKNGNINGNINSDKGFYQNYFLLIKTSQSLKGDVDCEIKIDLKDIPINPNILQMNHEHQENHNLPENVQHEHLPNGHMYQQEKDEHMMNHHKGQHTHHTGQDLNENMLHQGQQMPRTGRPVQGHPGHPGQGHPGQGHPGQGHPGQGRPGQGPNGHMMNQRQGHIKANGHMKHQGPNRQIFEEKHGNNSEQGHTEENKNIESSLLKEDYKKEIGVKKWKKYAIIIIICGGLLLLWYFYNKSKKNKKNSENISIIKDKVDGSLLMKPQPIDNDLLNKINNVPMW